MTDTIPSDFEVFQPSAATPDYDSFHEIFDEQGASNAMADQIDEFGKTEIDFEIPELTPEDAYPTVAQIEADLVGEVQAPEEEPEPSA